MKKIVLSVMMAVAALAFCAGSQSQAAVVASEAGVQLSQMSSLSENLVMNRRGHAHCHYRHGRDRHCHRYDMHRRRHGVHHRHRHCH